MKSSCHIQQGAYEAVLQYLKLVREPLNELKEKTTSSEKREAYNSFIFKLNELPLKEEMRDAIKYWTLENLEFHHPEAIRIRELHEMESFWITPAAHGKLLEAMSQGMISLRQGEDLIDELIENDMKVKHSGSEVEETLAEIWTRNTIRFRDTKVN